MVKQLPHDHSCHLTFPLTGVIPHKTSCPLILCQHLLLRDLEFEGEREEARTNIGCNILLDSLNLLFPAFGYEQPLDNLRVTARSLQTYPCAQHHLQAECIICLNILNNICAIFKIHEQQQTKTVLKQCTFSSIGSNSYTYMHIWGKSLKRWCCVKRTEPLIDDVASGLQTRTGNFQCMDHNKLENSERDGNTRPPDLPLEKSVCSSGSNSQNWTWNNRLVPNRKRNTSRLYIVTLLI